MTTLPSFLQDARVGVIGGSGLYAIDGLESVEEVTLEYYSVICIKVNYLLMKPGLFVSVCVLEFCPKPMDFWEVNSLDADYDYESLSEDS